MRAGFIPILVLCCIVSFFAVASRAQQDQPEMSRKVVSMVDPTYPALARTMRISGSVKLEVIVASNGRVKSVKIKGGHPLLAQAAIDAIEQWKWEPSSQETRESVEVRFNPQQ